jgi:hypothetical protein
MPGRNDIACSHLKVVPFSRPYRDPSSQRVIRYQSVPAHCDPANSKSDVLGRMGCSSGVVADIAGFAGNPCLLK